ncbi:uncharacterized protein A1O9_08510, partial [Exophiala aquamarina CBS 119918]
MHAIGTSHNCFSCVQADELHQNRHRQIAELVAEYKAAGQSEQGHSPPNLRASLGELAINVHRLPPQPSRHRYAPDEAGDMDADADADDENDGNETTTDTMTSDSMVPPCKATKAEKRVLKRAAKAAKSQNKAAKNQAKHTISVKSEDVELVNTVLHGKVTPTTEHPLAQNKTIEEVINRNMGFMSSIDEHKKQLMASIALRRKNDRERRNATLVVAENKKRRFSALSHSSYNDEDDEDDETETLLTAVLTKLGIDREHVKSGSGSAKKNVGKNPSMSGTPGAPYNNSRSVRRRDIVGNLRTLVKDDLEKFENDHRETCIRAGGFWRYVKKPVFERMTKVVGEVDWKTGAKLK